MILKTRTQMQADNFEDSVIWMQMIKAMEDLKKWVWEDPYIKDDHTRAEGLRYLTRLIAGALPMTIDSSSPEFPELLHYLTTRIQSGLPATDCYYMWAPIHGDYTYKISGTKGTARIFDVEIRNGHFAHIADWLTVDRRSDFETDENNRVEIILSKDEQPGNWVKLPEGYGNIIFRQYFYDWDNEIPANVIIERVGAKYPAPPMTADEIKERCGLFIDWLQQLQQRFAQEYHAYHKAPANALIFDSIDFGWKDLRYGKGTYDCAEDEAIILEVTPPKAYYWSIQLCSHFWEARDYHQRQSSLNGHQVRLDDNGVFTAVISHSDPGIANWLDAGGHQHGLISIRYYKADSIPEPRLRKVKLTDLPSALPVGTPMVSPEERQELLLARARSIARRNFD
ncbi:MAG: DUF1214 domain-containing protein [Porticoccaceae bacterium]|nr:DUF1214 domain-containing protein [Porticoccaceae bacterium]